MFVSPFTDWRVVFKLGLGYVVDVPVPSLVLGRSWPCPAYLSSNLDASYHYELVWQSLDCGWPWLLLPNLPCLPCCGHGGLHPLKDCIPQLPLCCPLSSPLLLLLETDQVAKEPISQWFSWGAYCRIGLHCQKGRQSRTIKNFHTPGICVNQWKTTVGCNSVWLKKNQSKTRHCRESF